MINKKYLELYIDFLKFGCFTFGGGWSIIAQMQKLYCEKEKSISEEELLDLAVVGNSLPGTMMSNVAMLFGYRRCGFLGGLVCLVAMVTAPAAVLIIVSLCYNALIDYPPVMCMTGIRVAVVPIIVLSVMKIVNGAYKYPLCAAITALAFALQYFLHVSGAVLVVFGMLCGLVICGIYNCARDRNAAS